MPEEFDPLYKWLGIPPDEQPPHCYRLLGVRAFEENRDAIQSAADRVMAYLRTLQTGPNSQLAEEVLNQVAAAKAWLLTPEKKVQYDAWLREQLGAAAPPPPAATAPPVAGIAAETEPPGPDLSEVLEGADSYRESRRRIKKTRQRQWLGVIISLLAAIGAAVGFAVVAFELMKTTTDEGRIVVQWPAEERSQGKLEVDGKSVGMASGGEIAVAVAAGQHKVVCTRPGYLPYDVTIPVTAGKTSTVRPLWRESDEEGDEALSQKLGDFPGAPKRKKGGKGPKSGEEKADDSSLDKKDEKSMATDKEDSGDAKKAAPGKSAGDFQRLEVPDEAAQKKARQTVHELYKVQFDGARSIEDKQALAKRLFQEATQTENDPVGQFVLFQTVEELAVDANDGLMAFSAVEEMSQRYQVDAFEMKNQILETFVKKARSAEDHKSVAVEALRLADAAMVEGRMPLAVQLGKMATREAGKARDKETIQHTRVRARELEEITAAYEEVKKATATLADKPQDPEANLVVGKYHCLVRGDWEAGFPKLAQGSDPALKAIARRELERVSVPEAQAALGDEWRSLAGKSSGLARRQMQARAAFWYQKALPKLSGLEKSAVERRLKELGAAQQSADTPEEEEK